MTARMMNVTHRHHNHGEPDQLTLFLRKRSVQLKAMTSKRSKALPDLELLPSTKYLPSHRVEAIREAPRSASYSEGMQETRSPAFTRPRWLARQQERSVWREQIDNGHHNDQGLENVYQEVVIPPSPEHIKKLDQVLRARRDQRDYASSRTIPTSPYFVESDYPNQLHGLISPRYECLAPPYKDAGLTFAGRQALELQTAPFKVPADWPLQETRDVEYDEDSGRFHLRPSDFDDSEARFSNSLTDSDDSNTTCSAATELPISPKSAAHKTRMSKLVSHFSWSNKDAVSPTKPLSIRSPISPGFTPLSPASSQYSTSPDYPSPPVPPKSPLRSLAAYIEPPTPQNAYHTAPSTPFFPPSSPPPIPSTPYYDTFTFPRPVPLSPHPVSSTPLHVPNTPLHIPTSPLPTPSTPHPQPSTHPSHLIIYLTHLESELAANSAAQAANTAQMAELKDRDRKLAVALDEAMSRCARVNEMLARLRGVVGTVEEVGEMVGLVTRGTVEKAF